MSDCTHPNLHFGSGDFYLFCHDCKQTWATVSENWQTIDPTRANRGAGGQLSGQVRCVAATLTSAQAVCDSYAEENQQFYDRIERLETALRAADEFVRLTKPEDDLRRIIRKALAVSRPHQNSQAEETEDRLCMFLMSRGLNLGNAEHHAKQLYENFEIVKRAVPRPERGTPAIIINKGRAQALPMDDDAPVSSQDRGSK